MPEYYEDRIAELEYRLQELETLVTPMASRLRQAEENARAAMKLLLELQGQFDHVLDSCAEQRTQLNQFSHDMNDVIADIGTLFEAFEGRLSHQPPKPYRHPHSGRSHDDYAEIYDDYENDDDYEGYEDYEEYADDERDYEDETAAQTAESDRSSTFDHIRRRFTRFFP